jgi:hypothetical protein
MRVYCLRQVCAKAFLTGDRSVLEMNPKSVGEESRVPTDLRKASRLPRRRRPSGAISRRSRAGFWLSATPTHWVSEFKRHSPEARVVKALNTVDCEIMIKPSRVPGDHNLFICGNDAVAKKEVITHLSAWFRWKPDNIVDLGDITAARGTEMMMPLWMRLFQGVIGHPHFNYHIVRGQ